MNTDFLFGHKRSVLYKLRNGIERKVRSSSIEVEEAMGVSERSAADERKIMYKVHFGEN